MSKAVLISIRPEWCEMIASGQKQIEIRKTRPKIDTPFKCYIYETKARNHHSILVDLDGEQRTIFAKGRGKIIGEFTCDRIIEAKSDSYSNIPVSESRVDPYDLIDYADEKTVYGWHISDLVIYDKPKELSEFFMECRRVYCTEKCEHYGADCHANSVYQKSVRPVKRPPQSWCYVEQEVEE